MTVIGPGLIVVKNGLDDVTGGLTNETKRYCMGVVSELEIFRI